jgi:ABC-type Mn2+/Zn2+ transport system ATPase subunit
MAKPIIRIEKLSIGYDNALLSNISFVIEPGEIVAITGISGLGKTTLLRTIAGLIPKLGGKIYSDIRPRGGIGYIPQRLGLVRHASVYHNVELGARCGVKLFTDNGSIFNWSKRKAEVIRKSVQRVGLSEKIDEPIRRLSGGQQRRVATARAIAQSPELVLADEFLSELDKENADLIITLMKEYVKDSQSGMLLVEHHNERAKQIADRIIDLSDFEASNNEEE